MEADMGVCSGVDGVGGPGAVIGEGGCGNFAAVPVGNTGGERGNGEGLTTGGAQSSIASSAD